MEYHHFAGQWVCFGGGLQGKSLQLLKENISRIRDGERRLIFALARVTVVHSVKFMYFRFDSNRQYFNINSEFRYCVTSMPTPFW